MRIATSMIHANAANSMLQVEAQLEQTQNQISSGVKVSLPSDDPVAAVRIAGLQQQQQANDQYGKNITAATNRLDLDQQGLSDATTLIQHIRDLVVQASNTGTLSASDRQSIATEIQSSMQSLQDIANRKDSNGDYLYSGLATQTQPFVTDGSGNVQYQGDQGTRMIQVGASQRVVDGHSGYDMFVGITQGNGTFYTAANSSNTGTGVIDVGSVTNASAWVPDNYTITFTSATTYQVTDSATPTPNVVATGNYTAGSGIAFNGVQVAISGTPANGDSFSVNKAGTQDIFSTLNSVLGALSHTDSSGATNAKISTTLGNSLQQIDQTIDHWSVLSAQVGARLNTLDTVESARQNESSSITQSLSDLRDVDYATALTKYNQQQVVLQAAQQSYAKIAQLSLFNYL